jgi:hypothetical protein
MILEHEESLVPSYTGKVLEPGNLVSTVLHCRLVNEDKNPATHEYIFLHPRVR